MSVQEQVLLVALIFFTFVIITLFTLLLLPAGDGQLGLGKRRTRIQVLVLGDIGRSPRMQYHALSIAKKGGFVDLVGYLGEYCNAQTCFLR